MGDVDLQLSSSELKLVAKTSGGVRYVVRQTLLDPLAVTGAAHCLTIVTLVGGGVLISAYMPTWCAKQTPSSRGTLPQRGSRDLQGQVQERETHSHRQTQVMMTMGTVDHVLTC